jgi:hypothetical protein
VGMTSLPLFTLRVHDGHISEGFELSEDPVATMSRRLIGTDCARIRLTDRGEYRDTIPAARSSFLPPLSALPPVSVTRSRFAPRIEILAPSRTTCSTR